MLLGSQPAFPSAVSHLPHSTTSRYHFKKLKPIAVMIIDTYENGHESASSPPVVPLAQSTTPHRFIPLYSYLPTPTAHSQLQSSKLTRLKYKYISRKDIFSITLVALTPGPSLRTAHCTLGDFFFLQRKRSSHHDLECSRMTKRSKKSRPRKSSAYLEMIREPWPVETPLCLLEKNHGLVWIVGII
ncbi:hypothetical protein L218DRAFT_713824 [Marasmius fiardii PR-910]|nr:hypothetical protein L218DRAFT_713824 [Marasmius fiardii PR-910]